MPNNECIPVFEPADRLTGRVTPAGGVRGKRFVAVSADITGGMYGTENVRIKECAGATEAPIGVSAYDGVQNEEIPLITDHSWVPMPAGAAIVAGDLVMSDAAGRPVPYVGPVATGGAAVPDFPIAAGVAITSQPTVDADVLIKLFS